jgi:hypothetical protein
MSSCTIRAYLLDVKTGRGRQGRSAALAKAASRSREEAKRGTIASGIIDAHNLDAMKPPCA